MALDHHSLGPGAAGAQILLVAQGGGSWTLRPRSAPRAAMSTNGRPGGWCTGIEGLRELPRGGAAARHRDA